MAKYIPLRDNLGFTYALDESEDYRVLDAFDFAIKCGRANREKFILAIDYHHLGHGGTLNDTTLMALNAFLARNGREPLAFVNGHTTNFARLSGADKAVRRQFILDHLRGLAPAERATLMVQKRTEAMGLPKRDSRLVKCAPTPVGGLSRAEVERRREALAVAQGDERDRLNIDSLLVELASLRSRIDALEGRSPR